MTFAKALTKTYGGKWAYSGPGYWLCSDGKRSVVKRSAGVDEWDEEVGPPQYWLYGDGTPKLVNLDIVSRPLVLDTFRKGN